LNNPTGVLSPVPAILQRPTPQPGSIQRRFQQRRRLTDPGDVLNMRIRVGQLCISRGRIVHRPRPHRGQGRRLHRLHDDHHRQRSASGSIAGTVYNDANGNGKKEWPNSAWPRSRCITILNNNGPRPFDEATAITNRPAVRFANLPDSVYRIREIAPFGFKRITRPTSTSTARWRRTSRHQRQFRQHFHRHRRR